MDGVEQWTMRLKDRNKFPPGGFRYYAPQTNFSIQPWVSFDVAVQQIIAHRQANPYQSQVNGWSTDPAIVAKELDEYNVKVCQSMNWDQYLTDGSFEDIPKAQSLLSQLRQSVGRVAGGVETIKEWEISGGALVPQELAESRAKVCVSCPKNALGDLTSWFTVPAAELIRKQLEARNQAKIYTASDPLLGVCEACACPLKLKVHCPMDVINAKMQVADRQALWESCWIRLES